MAWNIEFLTRDYHLEAWLRVRVYYASVGIPKCETFL